MRAPATLLLLGLGMAAVVSAGAPPPRSLPRPATVRVQSQQSSEPVTLLDRLPQPGPGEYDRALARARARGPAGEADVLWLQLFYGDAAAKQQAAARLRPATGSSGLAAGAATPEMAFLQFVAAEDGGADRDMYQAALRLAQLAPDDVATELAVRALSGGLDKTGLTLLDAAPQLRKDLDRPLADVSTAYMLGRPLLATVRAKGVNLTLDDALALSGRLRPWQLYGPFGNWVNLGFDQSFPIEHEIHDTYADGAATRRPQPFDNVDGEVSFPADWGTEGVVFAVTYVHTAAPSPVAIRLYTEASAQLSINGVAVITNDRRSTYTPAVSTAAAELAPGWNRIVLKLAGTTRRTFDLVMRPEPGTHLQEAATLPSGASLGEAPRLLPQPLSLGGWAENKLKANSNDVVALWVDGVRRLQDGDPEHARVELQTASKLAPLATPVWLSLADAYSVLPDASQSWAAAQVETASQEALKVEPDAMRAEDRLGHVYESEGKTDNAATAFAACGGKGYADCDWSGFQLATTQQWMAEAGVALTHALSESGSDWAGIGQALDFYTTIGDAADTASYERILSEDPRADAELGRYYLRHGQPAKAAVPLAAAAAFDDSSAAIRRQYIQALSLSGAPNAGTVAAQALQDFPGDSQVAEAADDVALREAPARGMVALHDTDFDRYPLRNEANYLADDRFWQPWYHSAADVIRDAPSAADYPNASAVLVLDQMVDRINPDSTRDSYVHEVYRVLNAAGIELLGDQNLTEGDAGIDLIRVRTIKPDGTVLLPEKITNLAAISMPGLEPGDFIETEYVMHTPPSSLLPNQLDNSMFFVFSGSKEVYHFSDYVVLAPDNYPLLISEHLFPNPPTVKESNGWTSHEWLVQKKSVLITEPHMPPEQELVPRVWVSSKWTWDDISLSFADHMFAVRKCTPEMQAQAEELIANKSTAVDRANAIFDWVVANIQPSDELPALVLSPARQFFTDRSGSRLATFMALLSAAKVPYSLVMARGVEDNSTTDIPSLAQFQYPLVHVNESEGAGSPTVGWYDLNNGFAQAGYIAAGVRGGLALVTGMTGAAAFTHVPDGTSPLDGDVFTTTGSIDDSGNAQIHIVMEFRGSNGDDIREALSNQPASQLPQVYQQLALSTYPNATATGGQVVNMDDRQKSLIIDIDATIPDFLHQDTGGTWDIERLASPVGLLQRYAQLPFRDHPLVINGDSFEQVHVQLSLPAKFVPDPLPQPENISSPFGNFTATLVYANGELRLDRDIQLKAVTVPPDQYPAFRSFAESADNQNELRITGTTKAGQ